MPAKNPEVKRRRHAEYMRDVWYPKNKQKHIEMVAKSSGLRRERILEAIKGMRVACGKCGESHPAVLDFHHRDKIQKEFSISKAVANGLSLERILKEIEKCDVLCANCHRKLHWEERQTG